MGSVRTCVSKNTIQALPLVTSRGALATVQFMGYAKGAGYQIEVNLGGAKVPVVSN